ncbi:hypothetical protein VTN77DRAFT_4753 [Rasamsonia byssochlamydoides]|uniref:uncharacterized protein n=1 Tax=Rasamsonia byssochlamydoides TaxID=89139 RepID=UPI003742C898
MAALPLCDAFKNSYQQLDSYPSNLLYQTTYRGALEAFSRRLDDAAPRLFAKEEEAFVPFRDLLPSGQGFEKQNILDDNALKEWLGDRSATRPGVLATKKDPKCRFIFISGSQISP